MSKLIAVVERSRKTCETPMARGRLRQPFWPSPRCFLLGSVCVTLSLSPAQGEEWTEFRGPTGQGHSGAQNLPLEWSATKNVVWKQMIPGRGWSSPVRYLRRVYLTTAVSSGAESISLRALCLGAAAGNILWGTEVFKSAPTRNHDKNSHASPTPIVENGRLYVHFGHYGTACLDLDGKVLWRNTNFSYSPVHG